MSDYEVTVDGSPPSDQRSDSSESLDQPDEVTPGGYDEEEEEDSAAFRRVEEEEEEEEEEGEVPAVLRPSPSSDSRPSSSRSSSSRHRSRSRPSSSRSGRKSSSISSPTSTPHHPTRTLTTAIQLSSLAREDTGAPWTSQGSDVEIESSRLKTNRPLLKLRFSRPRADFLYKMTQPNSTDAADSYRFCTTVQDPNFVVKRAERDIAVQHVVVCEEMAVQTVRFRKVHVSVQVDGTGVGLGALRMMRKMRKMRRGQIDDEVGEDGEQVPTVRRIREWGFSENATNRSKGGGNGEEFGAGGAGADREREGSVGVGVGVGTGGEDGASPSSDSSSSSSSGKKTGSTGWIIVVEENEIERARCRRRAARGITLLGDRIGDRPEPGADADADAGADGILRRGRSSYFSTVGSVMGLDLDDPSGGGSLNGRRRQSRVGTEKTSGRKQGKASPSASASGSGSGDAAQSSADTPVRTSFDVGTSDDEDDIEPVHVDPADPETKALALFLTRVEPHFQSILGQEATLPIFEDDFELLGQGETFVGRKSASQLKEHQSFAHIEFSKGKIISSIDLKPNAKGTVAFSCLNSGSLIEYLDAYGKSQSSFVVVWNFQDPIYPEAVLKSPCDVLCIRFHPTLPNLLCGGCRNGQVILWDLDEEDTTSRFAMKQDVARDHIRTLEWKQLSLIEASHQSAVNTVRWIPENKELGRIGELISSPTGHSNQFFSISADGRIMVWDVRIDHLQRGVLSAKKKNEKTRDAWIPYQTFLLSHHSDLSEVTGVSFVFDRNNIQRLYCTSQDGDFVVCNWAKKQPGADGTTPGAPRMGVGGTRSRQSSGASVRGGAGGAGGSVASDEALPGGSGVRGAREGNESKYDKSKNIVLDSYRTRDGAHFGLSAHIDAHPVLDDVFVTVGDWTLKLWAFGHRTPLWSSPYAFSYVTCCLWSPTRPSVVFVGRYDGFIEVWDFMDKSFEPSMRFNVTQAEITSMRFQEVPARSRYSLQYLAVGSSVGTLHIVDIPMNLIRKVPNEDELFRRFLSREEQRVEYFSERWKYHDRILSERMDAEAVPRNTVRKTVVAAREEEEEEGEADQEAYDALFESVNYAEIVRKFHDDLRRFTEQPDLVLRD